MANFWDERYAAEEYVYGKAPNRFFKSVLDTLPAGKLLVPGAGEGRDAVYAAQLGWQVNAFDASVQGRLKALGLASLQNVQIDFEVLDAANFNPAPASYDSGPYLFSFTACIKGKPARKNNNELKARWVGNIGSV